MIRIKFTLIFIFFLSFYNSQNLIYNGGFELYKKCPNDFSEIEKALGWKMPSEGTSDYFNSCSKSSICSIPKNHAGSAYAKSGTAYAGVAMAFDSSPDFRYEFIQTKFTDALKKNGYYCLSFFVQRAKISTVDYSSFSSLISCEKIKIKNWNFIDRNDLGSNIYLKKSIDYTKNSLWIPICIAFKAKGGENYLTIGYDKFIDRLKSNNKFKNKEQKLFYYIDDVSLVEIKDSSECVCNELKPVKKDSVKVGLVKSYYDSANVKAFVLNNLVFESNKSKLLPASNMELDKLVNYLKTNPTKTIELFGYTDNTGKELDNLKLSEARVKSVADYLINKGIETKRITFKGYGSKNSIKPNDTELNKAKNRRVEFKIK